MVVRRARLDLDGVWWGWMRLRGVCVRCWGRRLGWGYYGEEEVEVLSGKYPIVDSRLLSSELDFGIDVEGLERKWG
jgi:hypothetical protein